MTQERKHDVQTQQENGEVHATCKTSVWKSFLRSRVGAALLMAGLGCLLLSFLQIGCISEYPGVDMPDDLIHYPIGVAVHPAGRYAIVVNSNFNQAYKDGSVVVIDLQRNQLVSDWTLPIGSFGGDAAFNHAGSRLFVAVRGSFKATQGLPDQPADHILAIDIDQDVANSEPGEKPFFIATSRTIIRTSSDPFGVAVDHSDRYVYVTHLSNGEVTVLENEAGLFTNPDEILSTQNYEYLYRCVPQSNQCPDTEEAGSQCGACQENADCGMMVFNQSTEEGRFERTESNSCLINPFVAEERFCAQFCETDTTEFDDSGNVIRLGCPDGMQCRPITGLRYLTQYKFSQGGNQLAISPLTRTVYVTHTQTNILGVLRPRYVEGLGFGARTEELALGGGSDVRGLAFDDEGKRLYVASRQYTSDYGDRPGLLVISTELKYQGCDQDQMVQDTTACESNELVDFIQLPYAPANVAMARRHLYVAMFESNELAVVDMDSRQLVDIIDLSPASTTDRAGIYRKDSMPYDIDIFENDAGVFAAVSYFESHEIGILKLFDSEGNPINELDRKIENRGKLYSNDR